MCLISGETRVFRSFVADDVAETGTTNHSLAGIVRASEKGRSFCPPKPLPVALCSNREPSPVRRKPGNKVMVCKNFGSHTTSWSFRRCGATTRTHHLPTQDHTTTERARVLSCIARSCQELAREKERKRERRHDPTATMYIRRVCAGEKGQTNLRSNACSLLV